MASLNEKILGSVLKNWRHLVQLSQENLSDYCQISRSSISAIENGHSGLRVSTLTKILEAFPEHTNLFNLLLFDRFIKPSETFKSISQIDDPFGSVLTNAEGRFLYVDEHFAKRYGYTGKTLLNKDFSLINSGFHSRDEIRSFYKKIRRQSMTQQCFINKKKDGSLIRTTSFIVRLTDDAPDRKNEPAYYVLKRFEGKFNPQKDDLHKNARSFLDFTQGLAHELATPASLLANFCEEQIEDTSNSKRLLTASDRTTEIVTQLQNLCKKKLHCYPVKTIDTVKLFQKFTNHKVSAHENDWIGFNEDLIKTRLKEISSTFKVLNKDEEIESSLTRAPCFYSYFVQSSSHLKGEAESLNHYYLDPSGALRFSVASFLLEHCGIRQNFYQNDQGLSFQLEMPLWNNNSLSA